MIDLFPNIIYNNKRAKLEQSSSLTHKSGGANMYVSTKDRLHEDEFMEKIKELYIGTEVHILNEDEDPYPYEMFLHDIYELIVIAKFF